MPESLSKNDAEKWILIYFGGDGGSEYLSQADCDAMRSAVEKESPMVGLKDGRFLSTTFQRLIKNPKWIDEKKVGKLRIFYQLWEEYSNLKKSGKFEGRYETGFNFEQWLKERKIAHENKK